MAHGVIVVVEEDFAFLTVNCSYSFSNKSVYETLCLNNNLLNLLRKPFFSSLITSHFLHTITDTYNDTWCDWCGFEDVTLYQLSIVFALSYANLCMILHVPTTVL